MDVHSYVSTLPHLPHVDIRVHPGNYFILYGREGERASQSCAVSGGRHRTLMSRMGGIFGDTTAYSPLIKEPRDPCRPIFKGEGDA